MDLPANAASLSTLFIEPEATTAAARALPAQDALRTEAVRLLRKIYEAGREHAPEVCAAQLSTIVDALIPLGGDGHEFALDLLSFIITDSDGVPPLLSRVRRLVPLPRLPVFGALNDYLEARRLPMAVADVVGAFVDAGVQASAVTARAVDHLIIALRSSNTEMMALFEDSGGRELFSRLILRLGQVAAANPPGSAVRGAIAQAVGVVGAVDPWLFSSGVHGSSNTLVPSNGDDAVVRCRRWWWWWVFGGVCFCHTVCSLVCCS